jgi:acyl-coenzyme A synthetase/AMP-(fatty) acid ligase
MIPEAAFAMLACARIGAVHPIVFGGFSPDALAGRIEGCNSKVVITADEGLHGGRKVPLKANADADDCRRDGDGYYWITGRVDDVINVSDRRMGTAEVESALVAHKDVSEAAVVGFPDAIKGQGIYAYVTLMTDSERSPELRQELVAWFRKEIGPTAASDVIKFAPGLPKTHLERSCAEFCARSPRIYLTHLATRRRLPIRRLSKI